jgi:hypothetical protein
MAYRGVAVVDLTAGFARADGRRVQGFRGVLDAPVQHALRFAAVLEGDAEVLKIRLRSVGDGVRRHVHRDTAVNGSVGGRQEGRSRESEWQGKEDGSVNTDHGTH